MFHSIATPWTVVHHALLSLGFSRQEYWSALPYPSPGNLSDPGIEPTSPALAAGFFNTFSSVQFSGSVMFNSFMTPWTAAHQASLSFTIFWSLLKLMSIELVMSSNQLILYCPFILLPSNFLSIRLFSNEFALCFKWAKYWGYSFSISPSNEYFELICFRIDWLDLLAIQGTLKSLLQHHSSKASTIQHSAFFMVQLTYIHDYWKNHRFDYLDLLLTK